MAELNAANKKKRTFSADEFFSENESLESLSKYKEMMIPVNQIIPNENNFYKVSDLDDLIESIKKYGFINTIIVREIGNHKYRIVSGERRYQSVIALGMTEIPCTIIPFSDDEEEDELLVMMNKTQRIRSDREMRIEIEYMKNRANRLKEKGETVGRLRDYIESETGISSSTVQRVLTIEEKLIPELKVLFENETLGKMDALEIAKMPEQSQKLFYEKLLEMGNPSNEEITDLKGQIQALQNQQKEIEQNFKKREAELRASNPDKEILSAKIEKLQNEKAELLKELDAKKADPQEIEEIKRKAEVSIAVTNLNNTIKNFCDKYLMLGKLHDEDKTAINKKMLEEILKEL